MINGGCRKHKYNVELNHPGPDPVLSTELSFFQCNGFLKCRKMGTWLHGKYPC